MATTDPNRLNSDYSLDFKSCEFLSWVRDELTESVLFDYFYNNILSF